MNRIARVLIGEYKDKIANEQQKIAKYNKQIWKKGEINSCKRQIEKMILSMEAIQDALNSLMNTQIHEKFKYDIPADPESDCEEFHNLIKRHCDHFEEKVLKERDKISDTGFELLYILNEINLLTEELKEADTNFLIKRAQREIIKLRDEFMRQESWLPLIVQQANKNIHDLREQCRQGLIQIGLDFKPFTGLNRQLTVQSICKSGKLAISRKLR